MEASKKALRILLYLFISWALLVATHLGEFWPYSIYPMFSQAGKPWTRALIVESEKNPESPEFWETTSVDGLNGRVVSTKSIGVDTIDYSNFVVKTKNWTPERIHALRYMLGEQNFAVNSFVIYKVSGQLDDEGKVQVQYLPFLTFTADSTYFNPNLKPEQYFSE